MPALTSIACGSAMDAQLLTHALGTATGADSVFTNNLAVELRWLTASPALPSAAISTATASAGVTPRSVTHSTPLGVTHG
jgi:hypothetical protein